MIKPQEIYKLCDGFENEDKKSAIKKLISKGYSGSIATSYYNIWRRHYMESSSGDLMFSGIYIQKGKERKLLEECSFREPQKYLRALNKEQLVKITQAMLK